MITKKRYAIVTYEVNAVEQDDTEELVGLEVFRCPVMLQESGVETCAPSNRQLAERLGLSMDAFEMSCEDGATLEILGHDADRCLFRLYLFQ